MIPEADVDLVLLDGTPHGPVAGGTRNPPPPRVVVSDGSVPTAFIRLGPGTPADERGAAIVHARRLTAAPDSRSGAALDATVRAILEMDSKARHDIANQLLVLTGYLELLEELLPEGETRELLEGSLRAAEMVNRHLAFTRSYRGFGTVPPAWQDLSTLLPAGVELPEGAAGVRVWADPLAPSALASLLAARGGPGVRCRASIEPGPDGALLLVLDDDGPALTDRDLRLFFEYRQTNDGGGEPLLARYVLGATGIGLEAAASPTGGLRLRLQVPGGCVLGVPDR